MSDADRLEAFASRATELIGKARGRAAALGQRGGEALGAAWGRAGGATSAAIDLSRDLPAQMRELIVRDSSVPVYLLPTGIGQTDFVLKFDFREPLEQLEKGILVRPSLEVWAATPDVDQATLASPH